MKKWWRRSRICGAWDPEDGSYGRDTHVCRLPKDHAERHECRCGHRWGIWRMSKIVRVTRADLGLED